MPDTILKELKNLAKDFSVLYVEDEINSLEETAKILEIFFKSVDTAKDGKEGYEKYKLKKYDLVITDISMPKMDGIELIKKIKKINPEQIVIVISAHNDSYYLIPLINLGINGFILKPIETFQFAKTLKDALEILKARELVNEFNQILAKELEEKSKELAKKYIYDDKTSLLNRNSLKEELRDEKDKSLIIIDIKDFSNINLVYGYDKGDKFLKEFADFLKRVIKDDKIFYFESDKFAIVTKKNKEEIEELIMKILNELQKQEYFQVGDDKVYINIAIAVAYKEKDLCKKARIALEEIKRHKYSLIHFYNENSQIESLQKEINLIKPIILEALNKNLIVPFYQPIYNNKTGEIEKYEVLARIIYNEEIIPPNKFISIAERLKLIPEITKSIIEKSFREFSGTDLEFSINLSEVDLIEDYLIDYLKEMCERFDIRPENVILEILENISNSDVKNSIRKLRELRRKGFRIAIDDFGTQNSNFEKLLNLQIDFIKIDGKFIKNLDKDPKSLNIVKAILLLSKSLNAKTIAEFVHNREIFEMVKSLEIDYSQGYYISQPISSIGEVKCLR